MNLEDAMSIASRTGMTIREYYDEAGVIPRELLAFANEVERVVKENCAQVARQTVCDTHIPTGIKIYGGRAAKAIMAQG